MAKVTEDNLRTPSTPSEAVRVPHQAVKPLSVTQPDAIMVHSEPQNPLADHPGPQAQMVALLQSIDKRLAQIEKKLK